MPAGKDHYQFPLFIGEDEAAVGFSVRLESPDFPLDSPLECRLDLTFTYGEDDPYRLVFEPIKQGFRPIRAQWTKTTEEIVTDAPAPAYPQITTWSGLRSFPRDGSNETEDLLEWVTSGLAQLRRKLKRKTGIINSPWREDKKGLHYSFALCDGKRVFLHENNVINGKSYLSFSQWCCFKALFAYLVWHHGYPGRVGSRTFGGACGRSSPHREIHGRYCVGVYQSE